jgi:hypothetical protein
VHSACFVCCASLTLAHSLCFRAQPGISPAWTTNLTNPARPELAGSARASAGCASCGVSEVVLRTLEVGELRRLVFEKMPRCASIGTITPTSYPWAASFAPTRQRTRSGASESLRRPLAA